MLTIEEKKKEYQKQAIDALNRSIAWCRQVGINIISYSVTTEDKLPIGVHLSSDQIIKRNDILELREKENDN